MSYVAKMREKYRELRYSPPKTPNERGVWARQAEFVLSCLGFMVGLGNIMRFPFNVYLNGGGAFIVLYLIFVLLLGLPIVYLQLSLGQYSGMATSKVYGKIAPIFTGLGFALIVVTIPLCVYYNMLLGWSIYYLYHSFSSPLPWTRCNSEWNVTDCIDSTGLNSTNSNYTKSSAYLFFYKQVVHESNEVGTLEPNLVFCLFVAWLMTFLCAFKGIRSIGKAVYFTATFPYIILIILLLRGVNLQDGWQTGVMEYYFSWNTSMFSSGTHFFDMARKAAQQVFYSLSADCGALITMASYSRFHNNVYRDSVLLVSGDTIASILSGLIFFSFMGFLASQLGTSVSQVFGSRGSPQVGYAIAFITYSDGISRMDYSNAWSALFFSMLVMTALDCEFAWIEQLAAAVVEHFPGIPERRMPVLVGILCFLLFLTGLVQCSQVGLSIIRIIDDYARLINVFVLGLLQVVIVAYIYGCEEMMKDIYCMVGWRYRCNPSSEVPAPGEEENSNHGKIMSCFGPTGRYFEFCWKFIVPAILAILTIASVYVYVNDDHAYLTFDHSTLERWQEVVGWLIAILPITALPICAIYKVCTRRNKTFAELLKAEFNQEEISKKNVRSKFLSTASAQEEIRQKITKRRPMSESSGIPEMAVFTNASYSPDSLGLHLRRGTVLGRSNDIEMNHSVSVIHEVNVENISQISET